MDYPSSSANDEFINSWQFDCGPGEPDSARTVADEAVPPLRRLPASQFRSLGGYLDYEGWSDQQRFIELDEALRRKARESH